MDLNTEKRIFCENVKKLRLTNILTKKEMAKKMRIGIASLTKIENGIIPPQLDCKVIFYLSREFELQPNELFRPLTLRPNKTMC